MPTETSEKKSPHNRQTPPQSKKRGARTRRATRSHAQRAAHAYGFLFAVRALATTQPFPCWSDIWRWDFDAAAKFDGCVAQRKLPPCDQRSS